MKFSQAAGHYLRAFVADSVKLAACQMEIRDCAYFEALLVEFARILREEALGTSESELPPAAADGGL